MNNNADVNKYWTFMIPYSGGSEEARVKHSTTLQSTEYKTGGRKETHLSKKRCIASLVAIGDAIDKLSPISGIV